MTLGEIIKEYRNKNCLTMEQVATLCGITKGYVAQLEKNINPKTGRAIKPTIEMIIKVCNGLHLDVDTVMAQLDDDYSIVFNENNMAIRNDSLDDEADVKEKQIFARNLQRYMDINKKTRNDVCNALGISYYTFSDWVNAKKYPRMDKVQMLADYFGILKSDLIEEKSDVEESYYIDPEVAELAEEMRNRPELKVMLSAARDITKEDIEAVNLLIKKLGGKNNDTF